VLEEALPEKAFHIALECGWLPEGARADSPAWRGWIRQLLEGRFSRVGLEESCKPDPYLSVPFPVVASGGKAFVVTAAAGKGGTKKRGRPQTIPDERKQAALAQKRGGGTNRDAAKALYDVQYPTPQQVRNVPSTLRNYEGKLKNSCKVPPSSMKASRKINKDRG
jgi:hypothetical protein